MQREGWVSHVWLIQAIYFVVTGLWALVHIRSFQIITGPKVDLWLVKTVGALVTAVGIPLALAGFRQRITTELRLLALGCSIAFVATDTYYVWRGRIARIYLLDAMAHLGFIACWILARSGGRRHI